ncbi:MAG: ABC transporter substrate-binding protein [Deltaproteobacteria bacterium]|nr:ABC transporter substrate-binding protein [Deltaproteobacteria bacterium]
MPDWLNREKLAGLLPFTLVFFSLVFTLQTHAFNEAPVLTKAVKSGTLPPIENRLPPDPVVVKPVDRTGNYGGVWRRAYTGLSDLVGVRRILYEPLVRWSPEFQVVPNLAEKWEVDEAGKIYTFYLVKGVKWSDGEPFTADDIIFYFDDILFNKELTTAIPNWLSPDGIPPKVEKLDDYTFRIEFPKPYSIFLQELACPYAMELVTKPRHYLKNFHKKYADPARLEQLMKERNVATWVKLFHDVSNLRHAMYVSSKFPSLCAWITRIPAPSKRFVLERNPYYWKVDPDGNQLPYIDAVVHELVAEAKTIVLKAIAGEIDMQGRHLGSMQNTVLLLASAGNGNFRLVPKTLSASVGILLAPNINHKDPVMRSILSDKRFRIALSHAVNRSEINKIVCRGKGIPRQAAPLKESGYHSASYENAYTDFDLTKANALLDEMGLTTTKDGRRLRPDGKHLQISLDVVATMPGWVDTAEIVASNLKKVGIDTEVKSETMELFRQRTQNASHDIALWPGDGGLECLLDPRWYFPFSSESLNAPMYGQWFQSGGSRGEEPPDDIKELMQIYDEILRTVSTDRQKELFQKIIESDEKNLWVIGLVQDPPDYYVVSKKMFNLPQRDLQSWIYPNPGPINPEQFSFERKKSVSR